MSKSYAQKADAYFRVLEKNPSLSAADLDRRYKGTEFAMRKQDRLDLVREIKAQLKDKEAFVNRNKNSDMKPDTQKKLDKEARKLAYNYSKNNTRKGKELNKKGIEYGSVKGLEKRTYFRRVESPSDYVQFY